MQRRPLRFDALHALHFTSNKTNQETVPKPHLRIGSVFMRRMSQHNRRGGDCRLVLLMISFMSLYCIAHPHPLDEANIYHFFKCDLTAKGLTLDYRLLVGGLAVYKTWDAMDTDRNKVLSEEEKQAFSNRIQELVQATLDDKSLSLTLRSCELPGYEDFIAGTVPYLKLLFQANWKPKPGAYTFQLTTNAFPDQSNLYIRPVVEGAGAKDAKASMVVGQKGFTLQFLTPPPLSLVSARSEASALPPEQNANTPDRASGSPKKTELSARKKAAASNLPAARKVSSHGVLPVEKPAAASSLPGSASLPIASADRGALPVRLLLPDMPAVLPADSPAPPSPSRALQSLRPYLTGNGGVLVALGLAMLLGMGHALLPGHSKTIVGAYLIGARGTVADALLLGSVVTLAHTGVVLLFGLLMWRFERFAPERVHPYLQTASGLLVVLLGFGLLLRGLQGWRRPPTNSADASADAFAFVPRAGITKRDLTLLGLSGGMVPCADALLLLLFAHAQQRTAFGLLLVLAFGAGMAAMLVAIGLIMVKAGGVLTQQRSARLERLGRALPVLSATLILGLGLWLTGAALK